jgi:hypothetical protein
VGRGAVEDDEPEEIAGDGEEDDGIGGNYGGEDFDDDDENMEGVRSQKNQPEDVRLFSMVLGTRPRALISHAWASP